LSPVAETAGLVVERHAVVGGLEFEADKVDAAGAEFERIEGFGVFELLAGGLGRGARLGKQGDGALGVET
jgi:hypothetical protein